MTVFPDHLTRPIKVLSPLGREYYRVFQLEALQLSKLERFFLNRLQQALRGTQTDHPRASTIEAPDGASASELRLTISRSSKDPSVLLLEAHLSGLTAQFQARMHGYQPAVYHFVRLGPSNSAAARLQGLLTQLLGHENLAVLGKGSWKYQCRYSPEIQRDLR